MALADRLAVGAIKGEVCVIGDGAGAEVAGGAGVADLKGPGADGGEARVGVGAGEKNGAGSVLGERAGGGADHAGNRGVARAADREVLRRAGNIAREGERVGVGVDARGRSEGDRPRIRVGAADVAQGTAGADAGAVQREGFGADGNAALELERGARRNGSAARRRTERGGVLDISVPLQFQSSSTGANASPISGVTANVDGNQLALTSTGLNTTLANSSGTLVISAPGTYTVAAFATNLGGTASDINSFTVVTTATPPTVVINSPTANSVYTYRTGSAATVVPFSFTANSSLGGIRTLTAKVDNANVVFTATGLGTLQATGFINLPYTTSGPHTVSVTTMDDNGTASATSNFTVNVVSPVPTIAIGQPTAGATFTAASGATTVNVPYTFVTTSNNGFVVDSVSASLDGNTVTIGGTTGLGTATATSTGTLTGVSAGTHTLVVKGISAGIEVTASTNFSVTAATPPPTVVINTPAVGAVFTRVSGAAALGIPLTFTGTSTPTSGVITQLGASLNGTNLSVASTSLGQRVATGSATMSVSNAGTYTISVTAIDANGTASTSRTFSVVVVQPRTVYGTTFFDVDADGNYDGEDFGLGGITVKLLNSANQVVGQGVTDSGGDYSFTGSAPGTYTVSASGYSGLKASTPSDQTITITSGDVGVPKIGFSLNFAALRTMTAAGYTIGYWKNNIDKAIQDKTSGTQVSKSALNTYTGQIASFSLSVYDGMTLKTASSTMGYNGSTPSLLLSKQLLASEYNYQNGAYLNGNRTLTMLFLWWGEFVQANPGKYSNTYVLWTKDWFDAYNNSHGGVVAGPLP